VEGLLMGLQKSALPLMGSNLGEATGIVPVTKIVSQCVGQNN
jgi:hypothetical protein